MFCSNCGARTESGSYCSACGSRVVPEAPTTSGRPAGQLTANYPNYPRTSTLAVAAFVSGFFLPLLGIVLGVVARRQIDRSQGQETGRGLATAAIWLNAAVSLLLTIWLASVLFLAFSPGEMNSLSASQITLRENCETADLYGYSVEGCP